MANKKSQIIFMEGKEIALNKLFNGAESAFGYLAVGYVENDNGFLDPQAETGSNISNNFQEITQTASNNYQRVALKEVSNSTDKDASTGKVLKKYQATLSANNINENRTINQIAIVDNKTPNNPNTKFYSAATFPDFPKTQDSSITFIIGFRL